MSDKNNENIEQPEPETTPETVHVYSNYAAVTTTPEEFVLRFCLRDLTDPTRATEVARVFLGLAHAKRLVIAMATTLKSYEELFGEIPSDPLSQLTPKGRARLGIDRKGK